MSSPPRTGQPVPTRAHRRRTALWRKKKFIIAAGVVVLAVAYLITMGIQNAAMYYLTPSELLSKGESSIGERVRLGGTAVPESVQSSPGATTLRFVVSDGEQSIPVTYTGVVPDAFNPGADVVVEGALREDGTFSADVLLAKCPSKYVPSF